MVPSPVLRLEKQRDSFLTVYPLTDQTGIERADISASVLVVFRGDTNEEIFQSNEFDWKNNRVRVPMATAQAFTPQIGTWYEYKAIILSNNQVVTISHGKVQLVDWELWPLTVSSATPLSDQFAQEIVQTADDDELALYDANGRAKFNVLDNVGYVENLMLHASQHYNDFADVAAADPRQYAAALKRGAVSLKTIEDISAARRVLHQPHIIAWGQGEPTRAGKFAGEFFLDTSAAVETYYWNNNEQWVLIMPNSI